MVEDKVDTRKDEDAVISTKELEDIEKSLMGREKAKEDALKVEIEAKVRKEMETEQKLKDLEAEKVKLEALITKQAEEKKTLEAQKNKELEEARARIGGTKQQVHNDSPFAGTPTPNAETFIDGLTQDKILEIDENSKKAFLDKLGIRDW